MNQKVRIQIVEDDQFSATDIQYTLRHAGYEVTSVVTTGGQAVRQAEADVPDLVLMDINLSGQMDGIDAAEEIRARADIPIVYLTAYADNDLLERAIVTNPFGYLVKPFDERELHTTIEIALYKHRMEKALRETNKRLELEITERKRTEEKLKTVIIEKEILLHEIHRRVKNNMLTISSLLNLQAMSAKDGQLLKLLKDSQNRIKAMSFIHETLCNSNNFKAIDVGTYISAMTTKLFESYPYVSERVKLKIDAAEITIDIDQATYLGLVVNELLSNALKYAYPIGFEGEIIIALRINDQKMIELEVSDDGVGIPENIDWRNSESLGLQLVILLAESQLNGSVNLDRKNGTCFTVRFKPEENEK